MDPVSLTLGGVVAGLVAKAVDATGDRLVGGAVAVVGRLVSRLRARFGDVSDEAGAAALAGVEEVPDSPSRVGVLAEAVDRLAADPGFRAELEALVSDARDAGVDVGAITQTAWGDRNVQIGGVSDSQIDVNYGTSPSPDRDRKDG